jgi:hypothetical protein
VKVRTVHHLVHQERLGPSASVVHNFYFLRCSFSCLLFFFFYSLLPAGPIGEASDIQYESGVLQLIWKYYIDSFKGTWRFFEVRSPSQHLVCHFLGNGLKYIDDNIQLEKLKIVILFHSTLD